MNELIRINKNCLEFLFLAIVKYAVVFIYSRLTFTYLAQLIIVVKIF